MIPDQITGHQSYMGDGVAKEFAVPFKYFADENGQVWLKVIVSDPDGNNSVILSQNVDFTITAPEQPNGTITLIDPLATDKKITIIYDVPFSQEQSWKEFGRMPASSIERGFDLSTIQSLQLLETIGRCIKISPQSDKNVETILEDTFFKAEEAVQAANLSKTWAIGSDEELPEVGEHSSKGNAGLAFAIANADEDVPIPEFKMPGALVIKGEKGDPGPQLEECLSAIEEKGGAVLAAIDEAQTRADASVKVVKQYKDVVMTTAAEVLAAKEAAMISENNARASAELAERFANAGEDEIITTE